MIRLLPLSHTHTHTSPSPHLSVGVRVSRPFHYSQGVEQQFVERSYSLAPGELDEERLSYNPEEGTDTFPVAILMETNGMEGREEGRGVFSI